MSAISVVPNLEVIEQPVVTEKEYRYQPTDEQNRPIGGEQVIKYTTEDELRDKLTKQNVELVRHMRDLNKKIRLGQVEQMPADAPRFDAEYVEFKSKPLTPEERVQISRDLLDPDKVEAAQQRLIEAELGASPAKVRKTLNQAQQDVASMRAKAEADLFVAETPSYYRCPENFNTIVDWMVKQNLAPVASNFKYAYDQLNGAGLLLLAPIVREVIPVKTQPDTEQPSRITTEVPPQETRPVQQVSSGLNRNNASPVVDTTNTQRGYTQAEIDKMPSDVYKTKLLHEPGFAENVERIEQARKRNPSQR